jgi:hypothetical protein
VGVFLPEGVSPSYPQLFKRREKGNCFNLKPFTDYRTKGLSDILVNKRKVGVFLRKVAVILQMGFPHLTASFSRQERGFPPLFPQLFKKREKVNTTGLTFNLKLLPVSQQLGQVQEV